MNASYELQIHLNKYRFDRTNGISKHMLVNLRVLRLRSCLFLCKYLRYSVYVCCKYGFFSIQNFMFVKCFDKFQ